MRRRARANGSAGGVTEAEATVIGDDAPAPETGNGRGRPPILNGRHPRGNGHGHGESGEDFVVSLVSRHASELLATAHRHSLCPDDAEDAYQRALEIFVRRAGSLERETALGWLHTVVKHEAMAVREGRTRDVPGEEVDPEREEASRLPSADEQIRRFDRLARTAESLAHLKAAEVAALVLRAEGHSYEEICRLSGWSYTKVNRLLAEGRRRFFATYTDIESGRECERWEETLIAIADGRAGSERLRAVRPHLRNCPSCRARLRAYRETPARVASIVPVGVVVVAAGGAGAGEGGLLVRAYEWIISELHDRAALTAQKVQLTLEAASAGKVAAVAASATALAGGSVVAVEHAVDRAEAPSANRTVQRSQLQPAPQAAPAVMPVAVAPARSGGGASTSGGESRQVDDAAAAPPDNDSGFEGGAYPPPSNEAVASAPSAPPPPAPSSSASSSQPPPGPPPPPGGGEFAP